MTIGAYEVIITDLVAALEGISTQAGYNTTPAVRRHDRYTGDEGVWPAITVRVGGGGENVSGSSEWTESCTVEVFGKTQYDPANEDTSNEQVCLLEIDILRAIAGIDYSTKDYDFPSADWSILDDIDEEEPVDGVRFILVYTYSVDRDSPQTITGPL
jgi:hypothetical protein